MKKRVLLIGAGPTNSLVAYNIKKCTRLSDIFELHIWEKARGTGGRFSTSRNPNNTNSYADLGAQYLTQSEQWSKPYFESLDAAGLLRPLDTKSIPGFRQDENKINYVCCKGTGSIVKAFLDKADINNILFNTKVKAVNQKQVDGKQQIEVTANESEKERKEYFDVVISTVPIPQVLELDNTDAILSGNNELKSKLQGVTYTSRYALGLFFNDKINLKSDEQIINFVNDHPVIRYWSLENAKRVAGTVNIIEPAAITVHTSVGFGAENRDVEKDSVKDMLMDNTKDLIKSMQDSTPSFVKCHKWKYSQVAVPFPESPGYVEILRDPFFILSGDGTSYSGFEGCILSAVKTVNYLRNQFVME